MSQQGSIVRFETLALTGLALIVGLAAPGCGSSEHPAVSKARQVFQEKFGRKLRACEAANRTRLKATRMAELPVDPRTGKVRFTEVLCDLGG